MNEKEIFNVLAGEQSIKNAAMALEENGIKVSIVENSEQAKMKILETIPEGSEIMTMTSVTLDSIGVSEELNENDKFRSVRKMLTSMSKETQGNEMQKMGSAPDWVIGSVHAVTEDGKIIIASATGSQLPAYVYGSSNVIWVVGAQKIVKDIQEGMRRVHEYAFPLENERALKAYGVGSGVNKILIINKEVSVGRIHLIIVKEKLGF